MILVAPTMGVTDDYLEIISLKTVNDITADTKAVISYYGKTYTDDQKIALDDYLEGIKAASYYAKLKHIIAPFLAPNMTGAQISASIPTANKAFYDLKQKKLPDGPEGAFSNMFGNDYPQYLSITDQGIKEDIMLPNGSRYGLRALFSEDVTSANNLSCGILSNSSSDTRIGDYTLFILDTYAQFGAASYVTKYSVVDRTKLFFINHSSTDPLGSVSINNDITANNTEYNALNYDTTVKKITIFEAGVNEVGKIFSFAFISDLMTNAELLDFYTKTKAFLQSFGVI